MQFELSRTFPAPRKSSFAYVADLATWHEWSPITFPDMEETRLAAAGGMVDYTYRPLGIPMHGTMRVEEVSSDELLELLFEQRFFGDVRLRLDFATSGAHAHTLTVTVEVNEPSWWAQILHRLEMALPIMRRDVRDSFDALHEHFTAPTEELVEVG